MREEINYWKLNLLNVAGGWDSSIVNKLIWAEGVEQMVEPGRADRALDKSFDIHKQ